MKVAVLFGGTSSERDVSIASAAQVVAALKRRGHEVLLVDCELGVLTTEQAANFFARGVAPEPPALGGNRRYAVAQLASNAEFRGVDLVFLALHGGYGEGGHVQGLLELLGLPYTGSDLRGSAMALDKDITKRLIRAAGVPTADWCMAPVSPDEVLTKFGLPLIVKPNREGSTVGLTLVKQASDLVPAIGLAQKYDPEVVIERYVPGRELTVGVLDGEALAVGEIFPKGELFDYESKYQSGGAREVFPAQVSTALAQQLRDYALLVARAVKVKKYCRVDFRLDPENRPFVLEVNTLPGMTAMSLLPQSAQAMGISFDDLCERICQQAMKSD
jgi:D-alanine-D-alanine ligase